ncbi:MAG: hypothetical protein KatS3mg027_0209 [Bacteroidia bacterium]|nr:MAG: hypothetical protein KatS3mg027_0209 [Bacteroidia bacterium]
MQRKKSKYIIGLIFLYFLSYAQHYYYIDTIEVEGNKKTKYNIIYREFIKKQGDTVSDNYLSYVILRSQQNIFNTNLFVFDTVYYEKTDSNKIKLHTHVRERWYIWPVPIFEIQDRNFNTWWQTKDLFRINYGIVLDHENFTGRKDKFSLVIQKGYSEKYGIVYRKPYINRQQTIGFRTSLFFKQSNETQYNTLFNQPLFYRDYKKYIVQLIEAKLSFSYRKKFFDNHTFEMAYNYWKFNDTILKLNPFYFERTTDNTLKYFYLYYSYLFNNTDIQYYPLKGWALGASVTKNGLGISELENINNVFIFSTVKKFTPIFSWMNLANALYLKWTEDKPLPYSFNRSIGYGNNNVRGYEYYIIDGQQYLMTKNSLRFRLIQPHVFHLGWLKIPQFNTIPFYAYINLFFDAAYVRDRFYYSTNFLSNRWIYGYGIGLDFITYYDLVFRIEAAINHLNKTGIYLHLNMGI